MATHSGSHSRWRSAALVTVASAMAILVVGNLAGADDLQLLVKAQQSFQALPKDMATPEFPITPVRVELGRALFFDPRASVDGTTSCARCHAPSLFGTDGLSKPHGAHDKINPRNAPTVLNAALQFSAHWRGDRKNAEDQATQALIGPASFGNPDYASAMNRLKGIRGYSEMFQKAFPGEQDAVTPENWGKAIGSYERTLVTPSRFDQYLSGDVQALSGTEQRGLRRFLETGCAACHNGPGVGRGTFQKFGSSKIIGGRREAPRSTRAASTLPMMGGHVCLQSSQPAQCGNDTAILPRRNSQHAARGRTCYGQGAAGKEPC